MFCREMMPGIVADECRSAVHAARLIVPQVSGGPPSRVENRGGGTPIFNPGRLSHCLTAVFTGQGRSSSCKIWEVYGQTPLLWTFPSLPSCSRAALVTLTGGCPRFEKTGIFGLPVFGSRRDLRLILRYQQTRRRYSLVACFWKTRGVEVGMRRKEARVEVRMTEREKEILKRKAAKNGMTVSECARKLLANSDDETIRVIDTEPLRMAAHELAKQGTNLNQFMRFLNSNGSSAFNQDEAKAVLEKEVSAFSEIMEALAALRMEADRNGVHLQIEGFDSIENE